MEDFSQIKLLVQYENFFDSLIIQHVNFNKSYALVKNLSYNMQYLEFLDLSLKGILHATIKMEFRKTFVIIGVSIIESILYYIIKINNLHRQNYFYTKSKITSNDKEIDGVITRIETTILIKLDDPIEEEMSLDTMLKKAESKKLLGDDHQVYRDLKQLRKLRNKIHLYLIEERLDTDWNRFNIEELKLIKSVLKSVVYTDIFPESVERKNVLFDFLN